jgi:hypothetical protein
MNDLGATNKILGMRIKKVLERFRMKNAKPISTSLANHFKLTKEDTRVDKIRV